MSDTPLPTRGLLGAWFFDQRFYDSGRNRVTPLNPVGSFVELRNGVTVGTAGDPSREFGAAAFDDASNQYADVGNSLAVDGPQAVVAIAKVDDSNNNYALASSRDGSNGFRLTWFPPKFAFEITDGSGNQVTTKSDSKDPDTFYTLLGFYDGSSVGIYVDAVLEGTASVSSITPSDVVFQIAQSPAYYLDGEIAAVGRYDLTVPNAPEPSEIARSWDRLTDIPATR